MAKFDIDALLSPEKSVKPSKSLEEHQRRHKRCFNGTPLKDGEQNIFVIPAYDLRGTKDDRYGQHCAEMVFTKRLGRKVVSVTFFTGWCADGGRTMMDGRDIGFMCTGLATHSMDKADDGHYSKDCSLTGGDCWHELGSAIYGQKILARLLHEGSYGVWDEIDQELAR